MRDPAYSLVSMCLCAFSESVFLLAVPLDSCITVLPVPEKRALWLLDPPFEKTDDLERCVAGVAQAISRMRQTVIAIWYPIKDQRLLKDFYQGIADSGAPKALRVELNVRPVDNQLGLNGSGMMLINPPWPIWEELEQVLPWLSQELAQSGSGSWRIDWLAGAP